MARRCVGTRKMALRMVLMGLPACPECSRFRQAPDRRAASAWAHQP